MVEVLKYSHERLYTVYQYFSACIQCLLCLRQVPNRKKINQRKFDTKFLSLQYIYIYDISGRLSLIQCALVIFDHGILYHLEA
jgi:succinate dehydrogenase/fumarate reductase-like Fe-S protein